MEEGGEETRAPGENPRRWASMPHAKARKFKPQRRLEPHSSIGGRLGKYYTTRRPIAVVLMLMYSNLYLPNFHKTKILADFVSVQFDSTLSFGFVQSGDLLSDQLVSFWGWLSRQSLGSCQGDCSNQIDNNKAENVIQLQLILWEIFVCCKTIFADKCYMLLGQV